MGLQFSFRHRSAKGGTAELLTIALPMIISTACDGVMTFTDRLFLAKLDPEQMNAALGGGIAMQLMVFFFIGLTGYTTALVAQYFGAGQKNRTTVVAFQSFIIAFAAYPIILFCRPLALGYFSFMQIPVNQLRFQIEYFDIVLYGTLFSILRNCLSCYFSGIGRTRIVMFASLVAMAVNVVLDYLLIFGKAGFPAMGIQGAAYATVIGSICGLLVLIIAYLSHLNRREFGVSKSFRFDKEVMFKLLRYGYPAGLELFSNFLAFSAMVYVFHSHGPVVATASSIMFNWDMVSFIPLLGIEIAVTSLVGRYMGAGDPHTAHHAAMSGIKTGMLYSFIILLLFVFIPRGLVMVFRPDVPMHIFNDAIPIARSMIQLAALYVLLEAVLVAIVGALRGAGDTFFTMLISVAIHWSMFPAVYITLNVFNMSAVSAWLAIIIIFFIGCTSLVLRYRSGKWQKIRVVGQPTV